MEENNCEHPNIADTEVFESDACNCGCRDYQICPDCQEEIEVEDLRI